MVQEVLQQLPWPIIGIDDERSVALANAAADVICGDVVESVKACMERVIAVNCHRRVIDLTE